MNFKIYFYNNEEKVVGFIGWVPSASINSSSENIQSSKSLWNCNGVTVTFVFKMKCYYFWIPCSAFSKPSALEIA